jgi:hypothetical protein
MYKLTNPNPPSTTVQFVIRQLDNSFIPLYDPANTDYQQFLKYQAEGGKVYGADEEIPADEGTQ